jgi:cytochrome c5
VNVNTRRIKARTALALALAIFAVLPAFSARQTSSEAKQSVASDQQMTRASGSSNGEKKFKQNCSRCHEAPQGFSPRISGTILRHMRVRASLSKQDEQEILRFLNPQ